MKICFIRTAGAARAVCVGDGADWQHRARICAAKSWLVHRNTVRHLLKTCEGTNWRTENCPDVRVESCRSQSNKWSFLELFMFLFFWRRQPVSSLCRRQQSRDALSFYSLFLKVDRREATHRVPNWTRTRLLMLHWMFLHTRLCYICKIMFIFVHIMYIRLYFCSNSPSYLFYYIVHFLLLLLFIVTLNCPLAAVTHTFSHLRN